MSPPNVWYISCRPYSVSNHHNTVPSLGLHSAAATGNVGLVEYALDHGQPINSVLDGVLPLHAACAGGNVQVVKLLIDHGADVNAPRSVIPSFITRIKAYRSLTSLPLFPPYGSSGCRDVIPTIKIGIHLHQS